MDVLQLIAEPKRAAGLVISTARPEAAGQSLVEQPAVGEDVERLVGRLNIYSPESAIPVLPDGFEGIVRRGGAAEPPHKVRGIVCVAPDAQSEDKCRFLSPTPSSNGTCIAPQGSSPAPTLPDRRAADIASGFERSPLRPRKAARSPVTIRLASVTLKNATRLDEFCAVAISGEQRTAGRVDFGDDVHGGLRTEVAQHPLDISRGGEAARPARLVAHLQNRELHRRVERHVNPKLRGDAFLGVFKDAVAESMPGAIGAPCHGWAAAPGDQKLPVSSSRI